MTSAERARRQLAHQQEIFNRLTELATGAGDPERAARLAQLAARYASNNHPGVFASPVLETLLAGIGRTMPAPDRSEAVAGGNWPRRVLHVLTKAIGVGGHTRYALRWLEHDAGRTHSLALTGQTGDIPAELAAAVRSSGGELRILGSGGTPGGAALIARARELRAMASHADVVILYTHPHDVVPVIALSGSLDRPPVLFVNHSDHCFWIGTAVADLVACIRGQGRRVCLERRGIAADRCTMLPVPLDPPVRHRSQIAAKEELGLPRSAVVLLTVAAAYKYEPIDDVEFLELVTPVVEARPDVILLAVGPNGRRWQHAERRTSGRVRALGPQRGVQRYYEACDVYLDSHPCSSVTSLLEAASLGTPAMTLCPYEGGAAVLCSEDPGLDGLETRATNPDDYRAMLARLVDDVALRRELGRTIGERIAAAHSPDRWRSDVEAAYQRLRGIGPVDPGSGPAGPVPSEAGALDVVLCGIQSHPVLHPGLFADLYRERPALPAHVRALQWANLCVDEAGRKVLPEAQLLRRGRERQFLGATARATA
jgi:hypothetical protein